jgi:hypothetical protein
MNRISLIITMALSLATLAPGLESAQAQTETARPQAAASTPTQEANPREISPREVSPHELMTMRERFDMWRKMRAARTSDERFELWMQKHAELEKRAAAKGVVLRDPMMMGSHPEGARNWNGERPTRMGMGMGKVRPGNGNGLRPPPPRGM